MGFEEGWGEGMVEEGLILFTVGTVSHRYRMEYGVI